MHQSKLCKSLPELLMLLCLLVSDAVQQNKTDFFANFQSKSGVCWLHQKFFPFFFFFFLVRRLPPRLLCTAIMCSVIACDVLFNCVKELICCSHLSISAPLLKSLERFSSLIPNTAFISVLLSSLCNFFFFSSPANSDALKAMVHENSIDSDG